MSAEKVDNVFAINATIGKSAAAAAVGIEAKVKASMRAVIRGSWLTTDDEAMFRAGIGGALLDIGPDSEDGKRLLASVAALRKISALFAAADAGLTVDISSIIPGEDAPETMPLIKWWMELKDQRAA